MAIGPAPAASAGRPALRALLAALLALLLTTPAAAQPTSPAVAFHYGAQPPLDELQAFDWVVLEPAHVPDAARLPARHTRWFAYVSVGELDPQRTSSAEVPAAWLRGDNAAWNTRLVDHTAAGWAEWFETRKIGPLWQQGWRGFFLDTLDAHRAFARTPAEQRAQEDALVALVQRLHARFPGIALVFNRGFEILPRLRGKVAGVAAESLYRGWDAGGQRYVDVPAADRDWLLGQLQRVQAAHRVPVIVIDYAPLAERARARAVAAQIRAHGFVPYVTSGALDVLGVGDVEVQPRRIALVTDVPAGVDLKNSGGLRFLGLPLHWLGYTIDLHDIRQPLPDTLLDGRTAAVVTWLSQPAAALNPRYPAWLRRQLDGGLRLVIMHALGIEPDGALARELGLAPVALKPGPLQPQARDPMFDAQPPRSGLGWEAPPALDAREASGLRLAGPGRSLLRLAAADGSSIDAAALTPWGGFVLMPFALRPPLLGLEARWIVDPIAFLQRALQPADADAWPVPDVTTEGGRRLLFAHIDGDGFVSRAERPGAPFAGAVLLTDVLQRRRIPHTVSVIQGEIAGNGLFRELTPALEDIARRIFALPHVELASHSYSHPFRWRALAERGDGRDGDGGASRRGRQYEEGALNLVLPGYRFDLKAEIEGSRDYIDRTLAPPDKRSRVFLWTGDTEPTVEAVKMATAAGLLNMNGGDTLITRSEPTLTLAAGLGLRRGDALQVFAPMQNENVYTGNWTGPFYGYQRVIETFELTGAPRRLKPVNLYYHAYSATKAASLAALDRAYDWAATQPLVPVYASDYIRKVLDFHSLAIARDWRRAEPAWRVRGTGELRTLRTPPAAPLALAASRNVAGSTVAAGQRYVHLSGADALLVQAADAPTPPLPQVVEAAGWISHLARNGRDLSFALNAYTQPAITLAGADGCRTLVDGQPLAAPRSTPAAPRGQPVTHELGSAATGTTPHRFLVEVRCRP